MVDNAHKQRGCLPGVFFLQAAVAREKDFVEPICQDAHGVGDRSARPEEDCSQLLEGLIERIITQADHFRRKELDQQAVFFTSTGGAFPG